HGCRAAMLVLEAMAQGGGFASEQLLDGTTAFDRLLAACCCRGSALTNGRVCVVARVQLSQRTCCLPSVRWRRTTQATCGCSPQAASGTASARRRRLSSKTAVARA